MKLLSFSENTRTGTVLCGGRSKASHHVELAASADILLAPAAEIDVDAVVYQRLLAQTETIRHPKRRQTTETTIPAAAQHQA